MEIIKIFLACSIELEEEVIRFGDAIRGKNNHHAKKGIYFELKHGETIAIGWSKKVYNMSITSQLRTATFSSC